MYPSRREKHKKSGYTGYTLEKQGFGVVTLLVTNLLHWLQNNKNTNERVDMMGKIQQEVGKSFENEMLEILKDKGYWATKLKTGNNGTVFDILAVKNNRAIAIECKNVTHKNSLRFTKEIEKKYDELYNYFEINNNLYLAIRFDDGIYFRRWDAAAGDLIYIVGITKDKCQKLDEVIR